MKKNSGTVAIFMFVVLMNSPLLADVKKWHGSKVKDVVDNDLQIKDSVKMPNGATRIESIYNDISVSLKKDLEIKGSKESFTTLHFIPGTAEEKTITIDVTKKMKFKGKTNHHAFTIQKSSDNGRPSCGKVVWNISKKLTFEPK